MDQRLILLTQLIKLGVAAAIASALVRSRDFKRLLFLQDANLRQRISLIIFIAVPYLLGVWVRQSVKPFLAADEAFRAQWASIKRVNKLVLADRVAKRVGVAFDPESLFDCQVKRIHEYKRQLLNALHVIALYHHLRDGQVDEPPRTVIFAGKAAPGYAMAKLTIKLINTIAEMVNADPAMRGRLTAAFVPNYSVSLAEVKPWSPMLG